jgi:hypothetical protein
MAILLKDLRVIGVNLCCDVADNLLNIFAGIEQAEGEPTI